MPGSGHSDEVLRSLLTLSDVMSTGHHAAASAGVTKRIGRSGQSPAEATRGAASTAAAAMKRHLEIFMEQTFRRFFVIYHARMRA